MRSINKVASVFMIAVSLTAFTNAAFAVSPECDAVSALQTTLEKDRAEVEVNKEIVNALKQKAELFRSGAKAMEKGSGFEYLEIALGSFLTYAGIKTWKQSSFAQRVFAPGMGIVFLAHGSTKLVVKAQDIEKLETAAGMIDEQVQALEKTMNFDAREKDIAAKKEKYDCA